MASEKRLAIISSYDESCGNASYTHALKLAFSREVQVDVLPLDLTLLQKRGRAVETAADVHIDDLAARLSAYDYVNIQFEAGLYGIRASMIERRIARLIAAAPNLIFTMHRVDPPTFSRGEIFLRAIGRKFRGYRGEMRQASYEAMYRNIVGLCESAARQKNVWIGVHTPRERRRLESVYRASIGFDFPLAFLLPEQRDRLAAETDATTFRQRHGFTEGQKIIGLFGYLGGYKGAETALAALAMLPKNYVLGIFGGQHPQSIVPGRDIDPYIRSLLESIGAPSLPPSNASSRPRAEIHPGLYERVKFVGNLPDDQFIEALRHCDAVVLPYLEVGQSMSGVFVLAMEAGARLFCSNNLSFAEGYKYFGEVCERFDIGNHVELAQKITDSRRDFRAGREAAYEKYNVSRLVEAFLERFARSGPSATSGRSLP
jgi:glycosyltransferase involved in cell wall biosynthesis